MYLFKAKKHALQASIHAGCRPAIKNRILRPNKTLGSE
jgi:hypothetical protein